ncbi:MAG: MFS transporter [Flavobacterium sp.]|nr:MFS transporter [Candidatus Neoflavobacterium equi]
MTEKTNTNFSTYQKVVIAVLAITQFTVLLGFMIMAPMGDMLMKSIHLTPGQFGTVVSAYAFSAGAAGLLTAGFADRFDRKKLLLFFYIGFIAGTFICSLSNSYLTLILARVITGLFGGVIGSISLAIVTDLFNLQQRGRVMGLIQMGIGASQVLGIPVGLYLGNHLGWQSAFVAIGIIAICIALIIAFYLKPVTAHLSLQKKQNVLTHLWHTFTNKQYIIAYGAASMMAVGGYMIMPFSSVYAINNLKVNQDQLPLLFMFAGVSSLIIMPLVGRLSDQYDKFKIFAISIIWMCIMVVVYTNLDPLPFVYIVILNIVMQMGILSRSTPGSALISAVPDPGDRGAFMSMNASIQQVAGGIAAWIAGMIVYQPQPEDPIQHYPVIGYAVAGVSIISLILMYYINSYVKTKK